MAPDNAVVFLGDSITESLVGSDMGTPGYVQQHAWVRGLPAMFRWAWPTGVALGIGGDETSNLIARLLSGEADGARGKAAAAVLLIGTNNLGLACDTPSAVAAGILSAARVLCQGVFPSAALLVLGVLPRRDCKYSLCWSGVPGCVPANAAACSAGNTRACLTADPLVTWQSKVPDVNRRVAEGLRAVCPKARFADCAGALTTSKAESKKRLQPDWLHLSREGQAVLWRDCVAPQLQAMLAPGVLPPLPPNLTEAAALTERDFVEPKKKRRGRR